jgi:PAS domain S-box-containing protein
MSQSYFFNSPQMPVAIMNTNLGQNNPVMDKVPQKSSPVSSLEAELNTRLEIMDKTSLVTITDLQGTIMYVNDLFTEVSGFARHELIGKTHSVIRHPELSSETIEAIMRMTRSGKTWSGTIKSFAKSGEIFWCRTTIAPVMDHNGVPVKLIWMRNDITDLKRTERELHIAKDRADQRLLENVKNAFRIQSAILPSEKDLQELFPAAFLLNAAQQNVSGDFYWFNKQEDEIVFVLGDGTGHGVSGSFVSLIALSALEFIVKQNKETDPGKILTSLNDFLFHALNKHKESGLNESVDMAVCSYNQKTRELKYASGMSKIYLVRDEEVYTLDRDDTSIGTKNNETFRMNSKTIEMKKGDRVFMMSDGFTDQIGGIKNKRIGSRQVREVLKRTAYQPITEQKEHIKNFFQTWKGENEQTDDLSLLAFNII